jgi:hypothetical protein
LHTRQHPKPWCGAPHPGHFCSRCCPLRIGIFYAPVFSFAVVAGATQSVRLRGSVLDEDGKPVAGLEVTILPPGEPSIITHTDTAGIFEYTGVQAGEYHLSLNKAGFFRLTDQRLILSEGMNEVSFTVNHETEIHEEVEVYSSTESIQPLVTSHTDTLIAREIRDIPVPSTHDLRSSLQVLPEIVRDKSGQLHIAGGRTEETQHLLDGFDIGDPVTGNLAVRVNVDSVRLAEVESGRYGTQYGNAGAGVLALDTAVGDDRLRASANNFVPGVSAQRGIHLTSWYPRFTLSGPLRKERAWFSEALSVQHTLSLVEELPRDADSVSQWAGDNMLRTQIKLTPKNMLQGSFLYNQMSASNIGLGPYSPISTTRGLRAYRSFFSLKEQVWSGRTFYEVGLAADYGHNESLPHGFEPYKVTPEGSSGNYFESLREKTRRWQAAGSMSMPSRHWHGMHDLQFGFNFEMLKWSHLADRNVIEVLRVDGTLVQRTAFSGPPRFMLTNALGGLYANDTWRASDALVFQIGIRADWDQVLHRATPSPRISANFLPFKTNDTKFTVSWGVFLQPVMLSSLGPAYDQQRSDVFYNSTGSVPVLGPVTSGFALPQRRLKQPRFYTTSLGWEQKIGRNSEAAVNFTLRNGRLGLAYEKTTDDSSENLFVLQNNRRDRYKALQISFQHSFSDKISVSGSYTRSSTRTNRVFDYSLDTLIFTPQEAAPLSWDTPNRFVSSGWAPAPVWNLFLSYFFEYRTGFPFSVVNERQQLVGPANYLRFPDYASLNVGIEKHLRLFTREWAVRLTILNVFSHNNPDSVVNNVDSPNFMKYAGGQKRSFTARLRLVG